MSDNSRMYRPDSIPRRDPDTPEKALPSMPIGLMARHPGDDILTRRSPQMVRNEWNQNFSYMDNMRLPETDPPMHGNSRNIAKYASRSGHPGLATSQIGMENDKHAGQNSMNNNRHALDISSSRAQPQYYTLGGHSADAVASRQPPPHYRSSPGVASSASLHSDVNKSNSFSLLEAVRLRNTSEIDRLLENGIDVNSMEAGLTPLHFAAKTGDSKMIKYLLFRGANPTVRDNQGKTAQHFANEHNVSIEDIQQSLRLPSKPRNKPYTQTPPDWRPSFQPEGSMPSSSSYFPEMPRSLPFTHFQDARLYTGHPGNHALLEKSHIPLQNAREDAFSKQLSDQHLSTHKPATISYERYQIPLGHMLRPAPASNLNTSLDRSRPPQLTELNSISSRHGLSSSKQSLRVSEQVQMYQPTGKSDRVYVRPEQSKSQDPLPYKHNLGTKYGVSSEPKKPSSSFLIEDITKGSRVRPPRRPQTEGTNQSAYGTPQHLAASRLEQNQLSLGIAPRIASPYANDIWQNNVDSPVRLTNVSHVPPASFSPYMQYPNSEVPMPVIYPLTPTIYPYNVARSLPVAVCTNQDTVKRKHPHLSGSRYDGGSYPHRSSSEPSMKRTLDGGGSSHKNQQAHRREESHMSGSDGLKSYVHHTKDLNHNSEKQADPSYHDNINNSDSYNKPKESDAVTSDRMQNNPTNSSAALASNSFKSQPSINSLNFSQTSSTEVVKFHDTDFRGIARQNSRDTDLRPFLQSSDSPLTNVYSEARPYDSGSRDTTGRSLVVSTNSVIVVDGIVSSQNFSNEHLPSKDKPAAHPSQKSAGSPSKKSAASSCNEKLANSSSSQNRQLSPPKKKVNCETVNVPRSSVATADHSTSDKNLEVKARGRKGKKRKLPQDPKAAENAEISSAHQEDSKNITPDGSTRREKRPRKSETEDEFLVYGLVYEDFSSTEPENDDSSDEDFRCPLQNTFPSRRGRKAGIRNRPVRKSSRRSFGSLNVDSSFDEHPSDDEDHARTQIRSSTRSTSAKRGRKPTRKGLQRTPTKPKRPRKISSDSDSNEEHSELKSDPEDAVKKRKTKQRRLISSDKEETPEAAKPTLRKFKKRKKNAGFKNERMEKTKLKASDKTVDEKVKKQGKSSPSKKLKLKSDTADTATSSSESKTKKLVQKKKRKYKRMRNQESKEDSSVSDSPKKIQSKPKTDLEVKQKDAGSLPPVVGEGASMEGISPSLIELYTGKPSDKVSSETVATETILAVDNAAKPAADNQLFGSKLTETEVQALANAFKEANDKVGTCQVDSDVTAKSSPSLNTQHVAPTETSGSAQSVSAPPLADTTLPISSEASGTEKVKKKRGRKPRSLLQKSADAALPSKLKPAKIRQSQVNVTSAAHRKLALKENTKPLDAKGNILLKSRKGRRPGSLNKNKTKVKAILNKKVLKTLKKNLTRLKPETSNDVTSSVPTTSSQEGLVVPKTPSHFQDAKSSAEKNAPSSLPRSSTSTPISAFKSFVHSRSSTPLSHIRERRTPHQSPLPPNIKKLTCNSAIGETILHKAVRHGYMDNICYYLQTGFDVNTKDNAGYAALHEACVHGKLEAAKILLEFGADVNINTSIDGTRPIHDAIEYDHVEMVRLLLACGADPMLSKFSGRAVKDMIRSKEMGSFMKAYLKELKAVDPATADDPEMRWNFPPSVIFDRANDHGYDPLASAPEEEPHCNDMVFELFEEEPMDSYLVQPAGSSGRANYYVLSDVLEKMGCSRGDFLLKYPVDIKTIQTSSLKEEVKSNWTKKKPVCVDDSSGSLVELITANKLIGNAAAYKVCGNGDVIYLPTPRGQSKSSSNSYPRGAFCEIRSYESVAEPVKPKALVLPKLDDADIPCCSQVTNQGSEFCESPSSCESQPTPLDAIDQLVETSLFDEELIKSPPPDKDERQVEIVSSNTSCNGYSDDQPMLNGHPPKDQKWLSDSKADEHLNQPDHCPSDWKSSDVLSTSTEKPSDLGDLCSPTRVLTETESAVLTITRHDNSGLFDGNLSMMQVPGKETVLALRTDISQTDSNNQFCLFNNVSLTDKTKSPQQAYNRVSEISESKPAIL